MENVARLSAGFARLTSIYGGVDRGAAPWRVDRGAAPWRRLSLGCEHSEPKKGEAQGGVPMP